MDEQTLTLEAKTTALVLIDLQKGVAGRETAPHSAADVVSNAARLADAFRAMGSAVVLVRVSFAPDGADRLKVPADAPGFGAFTPPPGWDEIVPELGPREGDLIVTKKQWGAFYGTDLDLQLRRRGVTTIVMGGIATNMGVESTARDAYERGYAQILGGRRHGELDRRGARFRRHRHLPASRARPLHRTSPRGSEGERLAMKVVAFNGSPRKGGNTSQLLQVVLKELEQAGIETELVELAGTHPHGCRACSLCFERKDGRCAVDADPMNEWIAKMAEADGILLGSPTYFADVTTEIKALMDRAGFVGRANGFLTRKVGAAVVVARRAGAIHAFDTLNHFFLINEMIIPGSSYWNLAYGRAVDEVQQDEEGLRTMQTLGKNMAWLLGKVRA